MYRLEYYDWEYQTTFEVSKLSYQWNQLVFEGLDTHADVYLNGLLILQANNMHRTWVVPVLNLKNVNHLRVYFHSAAAHDLEQQLIDAPLNLPFNYTYSRKASYQYGWDWGPRLVTCGIWKPVYLQQFDYGIIEHLFLRTLSLTDNIAQVQVQVELYLLQPGQFEVIIQLYGIQHTQSVANLYPHHKLTITFDIQINSPLLWWPIGQGAQDLVKVDAKLYYKSQLLDLKYITTGIRIARWIQDNDLEGNGTSFKLNLNGRDIYMKGANYIPPDMFMPRALRNPQTYQKIFEDSLQAGYNGLRLWGGGQFEFDQFYELADKMGIMIWHDLMFACAMYPGTEEFLNNVDAEIQDNVRRLRIHPSIVVWNGNNEVEVGWKEWGWKSNRPVEEVAMLQTWYDKLFLETIPQALAIVDPEVYYWQTSPSSSFNNKTNMNTGDIHFWGVWASQFPIETYNDYIGRFNSEYGMQAMIDVSNFKKAVSNAYDWDFNSATFQIHERHPVGIPTLVIYLTNYTGNGSNIYQLTYNSQLIQYISLQTAISALRASKPYNMGTFYWQINDVWPVISWATVDFYGCWKAGHYAAKQHHKDPALLAKPKNGNEIEVMLVNDLPINFSGNVTIRWMSYTGHVIRTWQYKYVHSFGGSSLRILYTWLDTLPIQKDRSYLLMNFDCDQSDCDYQGTYNFGKPKDAHILNPKIIMRVKGDQVVLESQHYAKSVYLYDEHMCLSVDDNYFDLIPGQVKIVKILSTYQNIKYLSYYDVQTLTQQ